VEQVEALIASENVTKSDIVKKLNITPQTLKTYLYYLRKQDKCAVKAANGNLYFTTRVEWDRIKAERALKRAGKPLTTRIRKAKKIVTRKLNYLHKLRTKKFLSCDLHDLHLQKAYVEFNIARIRYKKLLSQQTEDTGQEMEDDKDDNCKRFKENPF